MRLTLQGPGRISQVPTSCHRMSCGDVPGREHVGVALMPAGIAREGRLALTALRCDVRADVAGLPGVQRIDPLQAAGGLLLQPGGPRHTSPERAVVGFPWSRTTSPTRNDPTRKGVLPALKDRVSALDFG